MIKHTEDDFIQAFRDEEIPVLCVEAAVVGSGCAAFNAADCLYDEGVKDLVIVTEGINMGTSRNTGSDKQTYYKLTLAADQPDSIYDMARTLFEGGSVHGDNALTEAAMSVRCFFKLVQLGVPFPHDGYGQYAGYKTDHDPGQRATSCGPLTSKYMTEALERSVIGKGIRILDGLRVISIITDEDGAEKTALGLLTIDKRDRDSLWDGLRLIICRSLVYATGGPSAVYGRSVYPQSQTGSHGAAFEAGASGSNLTEWQYGLASVGFRWNLSGTYQQTIPQYYSTDMDGGDKRNFLREYFDSDRDMLTAIFLKGYQWPFDARKTSNGGSSVIDMAVYEESLLRGRRVFVDYRENPAELERVGKPDFGLLKDEARSYLTNSGALLPKPIDRLRHMNEAAYQLYLNYGIDLAAQSLEISVCAQHNNGGLTVDAHWSSNIRGFYPVGECAGNFGVYRPGGSALNATQVGSMRAAQVIARCKAPKEEQDHRSAVEKALTAYARIRRGLLEERPGKRRPMELRHESQELMDRCAAFIRPTAELRCAVSSLREKLRDFECKTEVKDHDDLVCALINRDILISQLCYASAMLWYAENGGESRGSYKVVNNREVNTENPPNADSVQLSTLDMNTLTVDNKLVPVRPLPNSELWFETVYNDYAAGRIFN